ncbi:unnamed protein product [Phytophthora lilii]|uniref:Unnamed protein product n=1 Tax=Phytophthora lilii TaxID=2077276 RepID=A0A9W6YHX3_9STRA|nr:unnamed protein product [Phytophthora lilii]
MSHQRSIRVQYCKYDNVDRRKVQGWENIMREDEGLIEVNTSEVKKPEENTSSMFMCEDDNTTECVAMMEKWAANPSMMDYWIPATSLCETIDAVARWKHSGDEYCFCLLQLTKASTQV